MAREGTQKAGFDGTDFTKRWLESTTWVELPFDAYDNEVYCTPEILDGTVQGFDLFGYIHTKPKRTPLYVESKNVNSVGGKQGAEFVEFLANAYSVTARTLQKYKVDSRSEFMFVTRQPFNSTTWSDHLEPSSIKKALETHSHKLNNEAIDDDLLKKVSDRLWLLVVHEKQERLMLTASEVSRVESLLNRKAKDQ
jgi:hypothetical protein